MWSHAVISHTLSDVVGEGVESNPSINNAVMVRDSSEGVKTLRTQNYPHLN